MRWLLVTCAVALMHLLLLALLQRALYVPAPRQTSSQAALVLVRLPPPQPPAPPPPSPSPSVEPRPAAEPPRRSRAPAATPAPAEPHHVPVAAALPASAAASGPAGAPAESLLDSEATRRAVREAARRPSTGELGARASGEPAPLSTPDKLGQDIARGARGDCLKGEYAGSGMGLFSLPFWLLAELNDKCRR
jgi:hypothetical protein